MTFDTYFMCKTYSLVSLQYVGVIIRKGTKMCNRKLEKRVSKVVQQMVSVSDVTHHRCLV